jgi:hypothetical protein
MIQSTSAAPARQLRISLRAILRWALPFVLLVALFGQPNGLFLYLPSYPMLALAILLAFTALMVAGKLRGSRLAWPRANLSVPLAIFLVLSALSLAYSPDRALGFRLLSSDLLKVVLFYALLDRCVREDELRINLKVITAVSIFFAIQGLSQIIAVAVFHYPPSPAFSSQTQLNDASMDFSVVSYGIFGLSKQTFAFGNLFMPRCQAMFLEPGFYSNFLEMALFASVSYYAMFLPPRRRWVPYAGLGIQIVALLMTFSPIGIAAAILGCLVYMAFTFRDRGRVYVRRFLNLVIGLIVLMIAARAAAPDVLSRVYDVVVVSKFVSDEDNTTTSGENRAMLLTKGVALFEQRPLLGWGTNQTRVVEGDITNNAVLTAAVELGTVGLLIYLALLGSIGLIIVGNWRLTRRSLSLRHCRFAAASAGGAVAMIVHSMFIETEWTFYYWIAIAMLYISRRMLKANSQPASGE